MLARIVESNSEMRLSTEVGFREIGKWKSFGTPKNSKTNPFRRNAFTRTLVRRSLGIEA